jgi:hypothetical protein
MEGDTQPDPVPDVIRGVFALEHGLDHAPVGFGALRPLLLGGRGAHGQGKKQQRTRWPAP